MQIAVAPPLSAQLRDNRATFPSRQAPTLFEVNAIIYANGI
jgi:hypothetical protein